jgi:hypothetical protein
MFGLELLARIAFGSIAALPRPVKDVPLGRRFGKEGDDRLDTSRSSPRLFRYIFQPDALVPVQLLETRFESFGDIHVGCKDVLFARHTRDIF